MTRDRRPGGTIRARGGADDTATAPSDGSDVELATADPRQLIEVRVVAMGENDGTRWLAMGRLADGTSVTFVTEARAAEQIADAMAAGREPVVVIERRQVI